MAATPSVPPDTGPPALSAGRLTDGCQDEIIVAESLFVCELCYQRSIEIVPKPVFTFVPALIIG